MRCKFIIIYRKKTDFDSFDRDDDNKQNNNSTQSTEAMCDMEEKNGYQNVIY